MRAMLLLFTGLIVAAPLAAQDQDAGQDTTLFFLRKPVPPGEALKAYQYKPYRPIRQAEVRAAGFLTEGQPIAFGRALGPTSPPQVRASEATAVNEIGSNFAVTPPEGGSYRAGDTLLIATHRMGPKGWGEVVEPTGLVVVTGVTPRQTVTRVLKIYGPIRSGQAVFPAGPLPASEEVNPVPTPDGPSGTVIAPLEPRDLMLPGTHLFIDIGRDAGMRIGDFVQVRRQVAPRLNAADTIDEEMAFGQVVAVNGGSSTVKLIEVKTADIPSGTRVVRVATLPN